MRLSIFPNIEPWSFVQVRQRCIIVGIGSGVGHVRRRRKAEEEEQQQQPQEKRAKKEESWQTREVDTGEEEAQDRGEQSSLKCRMTFPWNLAPDVCCCLLNSEAREQQRETEDEGEERPQRTETRHVRLHAVAGGHAAADQGRKSRHLRHGSVQARRGNVENSHGQVGELSRSSPTSSWLLGTEHWGTVLRTYCYRLSVIGWFCRLLRLMRQASDRVEIPEGCLGSNLRLAHIFEGHKFISAAKV